MNKQLKLLIKYEEKSLQDNLIDKSKQESLCNVFTK